MGPTICIGIKRLQDVASNLCNLLFSWTVHLVSNPSSQGYAQLLGNWFCCAISYIG